MLDYEPTPPPDTRGIADAFQLVGALLAAASVLAGVALVSLVRWTSWSVPEVRADLLTIWAAGGLMGLFWSIVSYVARVKNAWARATLWLSVGSLLALCVWFMSVVWEARGYR